MNARTSINEQETPSVNVSEMLNMKSGSTLPTDSGHQHFVDEKVSPVPFVMLTGEFETDTTLAIGHPPSRNETYF